MPSIAASTAAAFIFMKSIERVVEVEDDGADQPALAVRRRSLAVGERRSSRPRLISPLSMRMLNPQVGLLQTQAL